MRPGVGAGKNAAVRVDGLHQAHGFFAIYLREASRGGGIVQIQEFDARAAVHALQAICAGAAKGAVAVVEDC